MKPFLRKSLSKSSLAEESFGFKEALFHRLFFQGFKIEFTDLIPQDIKEKLVEIMEKLIYIDDSDSEDNARGRKGRSLFQNESSIFGASCENCILSSIIKSVSRGTTIYVSELDVIYINDLLRLNGFFPLIIPLAEDYEMDTEFFLRNMVEYGITYLSFPNFLSGFIDDKKLNEIIDIVYRNKGGVIIDSRQIFHLFEITKDLKPVYNPIKIREINNFLMDKFYDNSAENICIVAKIPLGMYTPILKDIYVTFGDEEWVGMVKKISCLENDYEDNLMRFIGNISRNDFDEILNLIHFINNKILIYLRIAFEKLGEYIIQQENRLFGGYNVLINIGRVNADDIASQISTSTGLVAYPLGESRASNMISLHLLPKKYMNPEEYSDIIDKVEKLLLKNSRR